MPHLDSNGASCAKLLFRSGVSDEIVVTVTVGVMVSMIDITTVYVTVSEFITVSTVTDAEAVAVTVVVRSRYQSLWLELSRVEVLSSPLWTR